MRDKVGSDLEIVGELFEQWRTRTRGMGRIPDKLWQAVFDLESQYSIFEICKEIKIPADRYRKMRFGMRGDSSAPSPDMPAFVMLQNSISTFEVECVRPDGKKMICRYSSLDELHQTLAWFVEM